FIVGLERVAFILKESKVNGIFIDPFVLGHEIFNYSGRIEFDTFFVAFQDRLPSAAEDDDRGSSVEIEIGTGDQRVKLHVIGLRRQQGIDKARFTRVAVSDGPFGPLEAPQERADDIEIPDDQSKPELVDSEGDSPAETVNEESVQQVTNADNAGTVDQQAQAFWPDLILGVDAWQPLGAPESTANDGGGNGLDTEVRSPDRLAHTLTLGDMLRPSPSVIDANTALKVSVFAQNHSDQIWHDWPQSSGSKKEPSSLFFGNPIHELPSVVSEDWLAIVDRLEPDIVRSENSNGDPDSDDGLWRAWNDGLPSLDNPHSFFEDNRQKSSRLNPKEADVVGNGVESSRPDAPTYRRGLLEEIIGGQNNRSN
ncbi:MAG: hypothetical protein AAFW60_10670, partial [Pseudomonadota bacterium]